MVSKLLEYTNKFISHLINKNDKYNGLISLQELTRIGNLPRYKRDQTLLYGNTIYFPDGYWYLYSINELFNEKVYWFNSANPKPLIIDCGANIGLSVIYFKKLFPIAKIIAFEPDKKIFEMLEKNIQAFNFNDVELINRAVWTSEGELTFIAEGTLGGKVDLEPSETAKNIIKVKSVRLKDFLNSKIDFLKIDIEGAEYEVLLDAKESLRNVQSLFFEFHGSKNNKEHALHHILNTVSEAGFQYYIKESFPIIQFPFIEKAPEKDYDLMLNVFCFRE
jgi:FkbM family methyltransferase